MPTLEYRLCSASLCAGCALLAARCCNCAGCTLLQLHSQQLRDSCSQTSTAAHCAGCTATTADVTHKTYSFDRTCPGLQALEWLHRCLGHNHWCSRGLYCCRGSRGRLYYSRGWAGCRRRGLSHCWGHSRGGNDDCGLLLGLGGLSLDLLGLGAGCRREGEVGGFR